MLPLEHSVMLLTCIKPKSILRCEMLQIEYALVKRIHKTKTKCWGRPGQNDTWGEMKQRDFSNDDAIFDVFCSN